jgi:hypothetical protein
MDEREMDALRRQVGWRLSDCPELRQVRNWHQGAERHVIEQLFNRIRIGAIDVDDPREFVLGPPPLKAAAQSSPYHSAYDTG